ncbi:MAG: rod shape-determining protein MreC [Sulfurovum sp.]|nr:rod shape-determining protein MreC [Sulfurovum sp.]
MKTRLIIIAILLMMLTVLLSRNDARITDTLLGAINPVKQYYKNFTQNLEDKSHSYIFQKESIQKLSRENRILRKRLLEQMHYIKQVKDIYDILPTLNHLPLSSVSIVETISYVKLNSFSQIILTKPKGLKEEKLYGIIQDRVVAGVAKVKRNQLYGYLTSDKQCRFSVFIGDDKAPGIALGHEKNEMLVKFIPKWHDIKAGDKVITSGLDNIFFADVPVGIVTKVEVQSAYTVAYIKTYNNIFEPKTFFLINNAQATLLEGFDSNKTMKIVQANPTPALPDFNTTIMMSIPDTNITEDPLTSLPLPIDQTQEDTVHPETVEEEPVIKKPKRRKPRPKRKASTLDLF